MVGCGFDKETDVHYTVTELASNGELSEFVMKFAPFGTPDKLKYLKQIFN